MEINGFEIQDRNIHGLLEGKKEQICPKCSKDRSPKNQKTKCASADWERGLLTCHHCGEVTQIHNFKRKTDKIYIKPKLNENSTIDNRVCDYFVSRGINLGTLQRAKITTRPGWIEFNYWENGELINVKSRDGNKKFLLAKGAERIFYNIDSIRNSDWCVIVEGEIDALSFIEAGVNPVVSVPNGATTGTNNLEYLDSCIDYFEGKTKVILALDQDEAGEALKLEIIRRLGSEVCFICDLGSFKDANEMLIANGPSSLLSAVNNATQIPIANVNTVDDIYGEMMNYLKNGGPTVYKPGIPGVDDLFSVIPGTTLVITATPGAGKTYFIDQYCIGMNKAHGWKSAFASPESKPDSVALLQQVRKVYGDYESNIDTSSDRFSNTMKLLRPSFFYIDMEAFSLDAVLKKGQELVKRKGIKILVIDPINIVRDTSKDSIADYTISYFKKCNEFAKKNDCLVILSCHPVKVQKNEVGDFLDLDYYSIAGGADIANMSYYIIMLNRLYSTNQTKIKTLKVKYNFNGMAGQHKYFKYNLKTTDFEAMPENNPQEGDLPW